MLREYEGVSQHQGEGRRRWFRDEQFDLIVWYEAGEVVGFQLCYDVNADERAITWYASGSYTHTKVDAGDKPMGRKESPVLEGGGHFDKDRVIRDFDASASEIDPGIARLVHERLETYSG